MAGFLDGIGKVIGKIADNVQGRIERLKNEKASLEEEKKTLEGRNYNVDNSEDRKKMVRYSAIIERINYINRVLENSAKD